ncbi:Aste57867_1648 [Aphanomyces stellatus]|uniref:Aste57867_1648 protein n=1 Tax=Aphanomyces stellatus TaxID=120398 RepID=A0A485K6Y2_9STRA|nr:hypothetical protein As57867_001646 [Aphanomyces stellatus]VFT78861.1 Aste57867_1648 [Aphanomyces stellatus]
MGRLQAYFAEVEHHLGSARTIYTELAFLPPVSLDCKRGLATVLKESGSLRFFQEKHDQAHAMWTEACLLYEEIGDGAAVGDMRKKLDKLHLMDEVTIFTKTLLERTGENHERDAIFKAFTKFDKDNSGEMDASEFSALSVELGTFPALSADEIKEAFDQLDSSADNRISFAEFWVWWCTDERQAFLSKHKPKPRG